MSLLIRGMEMPKNCFICPFKNLEICDEDCPLIEVPPHGRLIDADAMLNDLNKSADDCIEWKNHAMEEENDEMVIRAEATEIAFLEIAMRIKREYPTVIEEE